jgi:hypothetical protein
MTFKYDGMKVTQPLDPYHSPRYDEPTNDNMEAYVIDQLYALIARKIANYINPTADGSISWRCVQSTDEDFEAAFNNW